MGEKNVVSHLSGEELRIFIKCLLKDLRALEKMLEEEKFETGVARIGAEQEIFLVGADWRPATLAMEVLKKIDDPHFTTELSRFNIELNLDPIDFGSNCLSQMEQQLTKLITKGRKAAAELEVELALIGILPTIRKSDLTLDNLTPLPRYHSLNQALEQLRGRPYEFHIRGLDELTVKHDSIMVESCNTSFQVHLQVDPDKFADYYNIAQLLAGPVLAVSTNSPLLFGKRLWQETRIALFQQSVDTRHSSFYMRESSPRVTFGTKWIRDSVLELYHEDASRFQPLLGADLDEDPFLKLSEGSIPQLKALRLQNGTVYRWNRACYGITNGKPHLRIENRVLPAGPTIIDEIANAALWLGLMNGIYSNYKNITEKISFEDAKMNFYSAARMGLQTQFAWFNGEKVPVQTLIAQQLLPMAREGLQNSGINKSDIDRYLGVIEKRVRLGKSGAEWLLGSYSKLKGKATNGEQLNILISETIKKQKEGRPVAEWELANIDDGCEFKPSHLKVEQYMTTDLFTVHEDEPVELVINLMDWNKIRHVPVENSDNRLTGIISYRTILRLLAQEWYGSDKRLSSVSEIMKRDLITISPETTTMEAIELMERNKISCLPVLQDGHLVGIVTERDLIKITSRLLKQQFKKTQSAALSSKAPRGKDRGKGFQERFFPAS